MNLESSDYRVVLKDALLEKKASIGSMFSFQNLARACRVQKTYLSKVLNLRGHFNSDQLYLACEFLGFKSGERDFIFLLYGAERTTVAKRKSDLQRQIDLFRKEQVKTERHLRANTAPLAEKYLTDYYLNPLFQIIHMFLTVDRFAKNINLICEALKIGADEVNDALRQLQNMGIIDFKAGRYHVNKDDLHLPKDAPIYKPYRNLLRMKSYDQIDRLSTEGVYSFSAIFSTNEKVRAKIQLAFMEFLKKTQDMVHKGTSEEVYQMNFDLFDWS